MSTYPNVSSGKQLFVHSNCPKILAARIRKSLLQKLSLPGGSCYPSPSYTLKPSSIATSADRDRHTLKILLQGISLCPVDEAC
jgi:hypothetical protein